MSTGKTLGVVPTIITLLFERIEALRAARPGFHARCRVSFVQIYKVCGCERIAHPLSYASLLPK